MKSPYLAKTFDTLQGFLVPIVLLALWQWLSSQAIVNPQILPAPTAVLAKWWEYLMPTQAYDPATSGYLAWLLSGEMIRDAYASLYRVVVGFLLGAVLALPLGLMMGAERPHLQPVQSVDPDTAANSADRFYPAVHSVVWSGQSAGNFPDRHWRIFSCPDEYHRRRAQC